jgi:hypothetical protein
MVGAIRHRTLFHKGETLRKILFILAASMAFFLPVSAHAFCYGVSDPISPISPSGNVCGTLYQRTYNGSAYGFRNAAQSYVKICPTGVASNSFACTTTSTQSYPDGSGTPGQTVQAFTFLHFRQGATGYATYDFYAWGTSDYWGSSTRPMTRIQLGDASPGVGTEGIALFMAPRPLDPTPVYPSGNAVGSSYTVTWKSGIDTDRKPYPVNYEVWFKYWPFGGTEPASWTLSRANMPCQDNGGGPNVRGECSTYVAGPQASGNWKWYVVANLNVSAVTLPNTTLTTNSGALYFSAP